MVVIGLAYLVFEEKLLSRTKLAVNSTEHAENGLSRALIGAQVSDWRCSHGNVTDDSRLASSS